MTHNVKLGKDKYVLLPVEQIILPENELILILNTSAIGHGKVIATVNGEQINAAGGLNLSRFLQEGIIRITVDLFVDCQSIMTWQLSPILVRKVETNYEILPEIVAINERLTAAEENVTLLKAAVKELKKIIEGDDL